MSEDTKHGTRSTYVQYGCRCVRCQDANTEFFRTYRERRKEFLASNDERLIHGTIYAHQVLDCRCERCKSAGRVYRAKRCALFRAGHLPHVQHGTHLAYNSYGCRCEPCREADRASRRTLKMRHRVADKLNP